MAVGKDARQRQRRQAFHSALLLSLLLARAKSLPTLHSCSASAATSGAPTPPLVPHPPHSSPLSLAGDVVLALLHPAYPALLPSLARHGRALLCGTLLFPLNAKYETNRGREPLAASQLVIGGDAIRYNHADILMPTIIFNCNQRAKSPMQIHN